MGKWGEETAPRARVLHVTGSWAWAEGARVVTEQIFF